MHLTAEPSSSQQPGQNIAVVGTGIAGLSAAWFLRHTHNLTIFDAGDHIGGHTHTHQIANGQQTTPVDTGFIVHNSLNYPNLCRLFEELGVATRDSDMSFSNRLANGHEWRGGNIPGLFAQKSNLFRPQHWKMVRDILRFHKEAGQLATENPTATLADLPSGYGSWFRERFLYPITGAIWSQPAQEAADLPLEFVVRFMEHHRMLQTGNRPQWRTVVGGSNQYIEPMTKDFADRIYLHTPVQEIVRNEDATVTVRTYDQKSGTGAEHQFDQVIVASHSDQALKMLTQPSAAEEEILGAIAYRPNTTVLHTDVSLMPQNRAAWASWNAHPGSDPTATAVTYDLTHLQGLPGPNRFLVSLESEKIIRTPFLKKLDYAHPQLTHAGSAAQKRWSEISGVNGVHYCGAYWGFGFHEDGFVSGMRVANALGGGW